MTYPRAHTVSPNVGRYYHCTSRCVRRAWLCGTDELTGRSFEHRKHWIESRLLGLAEIFSVRLWGYAVMSNHYHVVVQTKPEQVADWSDEEVATRWMRLCKIPDEDTRARRVAATLGNAERLKELRQRLGSLSWFMRYINEPLARMANHEDGCTGRFWEGRFGASALLDEGAVLAAMVYDDLNPVRAGAIDTPDQAEHTALAHRLRTQTESDHRLGRLGELGISLGDYLALVRWTAKRDQSPDPRPPVAILAIGTAEDWRQRIKARRKRCRAQGSVPLLRQFAEACGQSWVAGVGWAPSA